MSFFFYSNLPSGSVHKNLHDAFTVPEIGFGAKQQMRDAKDTFFNVVRKSTENEDYILTGLSGLQK